MLICHVVGARPNFMKAAPVMRALAKYCHVRQTLVHTGQHYDLNMSGVFFQELELPSPDVNLLVGSGSHAKQTAEIMTRFEAVVLDLKPDLVLVYGDVNSALAAALVCSKLLVRVGHVEAGLRSFDRTMPEEVNRILTDRISDLLFTPSEDANRNLAAEGVPPQNVHWVGNVMIDKLVHNLPKTEAITHQLPDKFALLTLHRPSNVDDIPWLAELLSALGKIGERTTVLFPIHPRTRKRIEEGGLSQLANGSLRFLEPLPYIPFLALQRRASFVITDSGGIQEETTFLGVPCITVRENTERPVTVTQGTNTLVGRDPNRVSMEVERILAGHNGHCRGRVPEFWDGHAAERIAQIITS